MVPHGVRNAGGGQFKNLRVFTDALDSRMLPRMIQMGPKLVTTEQWVSRRKKLPKVG